MARQSNHEILSRYQRQISAAKKWRRQEDIDGTWQRLIDLYRGKHYDYLTDEDRLLINISFSTVNVIAPSVAVNYPKIAVNATKPDDAPRAIITEAVVNYWWRHYKIRPQFRQAVKDFLIVGHGWLKCGYRFVEEDKEVDDGNEQIEAEANQITSVTVVTEDRPFVDRVSPFDMFVDPDATSMADARWVAQRIRRPMKEVKNDKRYSAKARESLEGQTMTRYSEDPHRREIRDPDEKFVELWEYYDLTNKTMCVFADCEHFLVKPTKMPYTFGHPFVMIRNYDVPDQFYPMGDLEAIEPLQRELNETRTQMMNHRKRFARKYLVREDAFGADGRAALESDEDNTMVPVQGDENLNNVVAPFPATMTPPEFYNQSQIIQGDVEYVTGVSEYQRGGLPEIRRTATEAAIMQDAANARAADKLATIEQSIAEVAQRMVQLAQQFMDGEQVARVVGRDGMPRWVTFDPEYIAGEFDFEVEAGSTAPMNESFRRQSALQLVDAMAPFASAGIVDMGKLAAHVLQFGFGIKNAESFLMQQQPPEMAPPDQQGALPPGPPMGGGMPMSDQMMDPTMGGQEGGYDPLAATPQDLSGIDPSVLASLSSRLGFALPNT